MCLLIRDLESSTEPSHTPPQPLWCLKPPSPPQVFSRCSYSGRLIHRGVFPRTPSAGRGQGLPGVRCTRQSLLLAALVGSSLGYGQKSQLSEPRVDPLASGSPEPHASLLGTSSPCGAGALVLPVPLLL